MPDLGKPLRAALSAAFCVLVLVAMLVRHAWPLMTGEPIVLEVVAYDPRDIFRGDYVVLTYPINWLIASTEDYVPDPNSPAAGRGVVVEPLGEAWDELKEQLAAGNYYTRPSWRDRTVYVQLRPEPSEVPGIAQLHRAVSVSDVPVAGSVNIAGRIRWLDRAQWDDPNSPVEIQLHYGIDALYVQEGTGRQIEEAIRAGKVHAVVAVTSSGTARLQDLIIDGRTWSSIRDGQ